MDIQQITNEFYDYCIYFRGYKPATIKRYIYVLRVFFAFAHIEAVHDITEEKVRSLFFHGRTERKWSANTFLVFYKSLKVFFAWCFKQGHLAVNPIAGIEKPRLEKRLPPKLTKQDALKLLEIVNNYQWPHPYLRYRNHAIFATFVFAGLRLKELLNLKLTDVDLENMTIFINQGKGGKDRLVPICMQLKDILSKYLLERKKLHKTCSAFFVSLHRNVSFTESGMKNLVVQIRKASGLSFSVHKLRHTFATLMLEGGCDIYSLSRMMGHSDINTTTIYLYATTEHLRQQIAKHPLNS